MRILIKDKNRFPLPGTNGRFMHLATIHYGVREYIYFADVKTHNTYIEEITGGTLNEIEDDSLWHDLAMALKEAGADIMIQKDE